eukprot:GFYU01013522.1.p1 GENE.GFYU01013522.1~~GFYU01013522.1.p1  ORF type:complete len:214 (-),score=47.47 GFYU01013522.1:114-755(-)
MNHNMLASMFGIASHDQKQRILHAVDTAYTQICDRKNVTRGVDIFSTPCNLKPLSQRCENVDNHIPVQSCSNDDPPYDPWVNYPTYENGQSFFHSAGLEAAGRAAAGDTSGAWNTFSQLMMNGVRHNRGWAQGSLFSKLLGFDPLNNSVLSVWGTLRGLMRVVPTLTRGVLMNDDSNFPRGSSVPEMEGTQWRFAYLGDEFCVEYRDGESVEC